MYIYIYICILLTTGYSTFAFLSKLVEEDMQNLLFGDYMNPDLEEDECLYSEVPSMEGFAQVVESCLDEYNQMHKNRMNLVIFR